MTIRAIPAIETSIIDLYLTAKARHGILTKASSGLTLNPYGLHSTRLCAARAASTAAGTMESQVSRAFGRAMRDKPIRGNALGIYVTKPIPMNVMKSCFSPTRTPPRLSPLLVPNSKCSNSPQAATIRDSRLLPLPRQHKSQGFPN